jgi:hypothetical protein
MGANYNVEDYASEGDESGAEHDAEWEKNMQEKFEKAVRSFLLDMSISDENACELAKK